MQLHHCRYLLLFCWHKKKPVTSRCPIFKTNYLKTNLLKQIKNIITILVYYFGCKYKH